MNINLTRSALTKLVNEKNCGPILIRLVWHDAATWNKATRKGGPHACMRFEGSGESIFVANTGMDIAIKLLQPIKDGPAVDMSYSDFWVLAAIVATKVMGGPDIPFRVGRVDATSADEGVEEGLHPNPTKGADHLRDILVTRMGLTDQDVVALSGAHTVGRCHLERSGFDGPWTAEPLKFDNTYFIDLLNKKWVEATTSKGAPQFNDAAGTGTMMLISDMALLEDEKFKAYVEKYAKDQDAFFADYATAFQKLSELGGDDLKEP